MATLEANPQQDLGLDLTRLLPGPADLIDPARSSEFSQAFVVEKLGVTQSIVIEGSGIDLFLARPSGLDLETATQAWEGLTNWVNICHQLIDWSGQMQRGQLDPDFLHTPIEVGIEEIDGRPVGEFIFSAEKLPETKADVLKDSENLIGIAEIFFQPPDVRIARSYVLLSESHFANGSEDKGIAAARHARVLYERCGVEGVDDVFMLSRLLFFTHQRRGENHEMIAEAKRTVEVADSMPGQPLAKRLEARQFEMLAYHYTDDSSALEQAVADYQSCLLPVELDDPDQILPALNQTVVFALNLATLGLDAQSETLLGIATRYMQRIPETDDLADARAALANLLEQAKARRQSATTTSPSSGTTTGGSSTTTGPGSS